MPKVLEIGPYRFFWYSADRNEPPHVHVERDRNSAKIWLRPVRVACNNGFKGQELRRIEKIVQDHQERLLRRWNA